MPPGWNWELRFPRAFHGKDMLVKHMQPEVKVQLSVFSPEQQMHGPCLEVTQG